MRSCSTGAVSQLFLSRSVHCCGVRYHALGCSDRRIGREMRIESGGGAGIGGAGIRSRSASSRGLTWTAI